MDKELKKYMERINDYYLGDRKLSTQEVMEILLGRANNDEEKKGSSSFVNFDMDELLKWKTLNNEKYMVKINYPIVSHKKIIGKYIIFWKKIIRRLLRWLIHPIVIEQNEFNASVTASINAIYNNEVVTHEVLNRLYGDKYNLAEIDNKLNEINEIIENNLLKHIENCKAKEAINIVNTVSEKYENLETIMKEEQILDYDNKKIANIESRVEKLQENMNYFSYRLRKNSKNFVTGEKIVTNT